MFSFAHCMLWLALASDAPAVQEYTLSQRQFKIPLLVEAGKRSQIERVVLYVSTDAGKSWRAADMGTPEQSDFTYRAPADGSYWFAVQIVKKDGTKTPPEASGLQAQIKVVVRAAAPPPAAPPLPQPLSSRESAKPSNVEEELAELRARIARLEEQLRSIKKPKKPKKRKG